MGFFEKFKKKTLFVEPPIPESEKKYYQPDNYYTEYAHKGTQFEKRVIPFDERKTISYPSKNGLFVAEILLLEYCSYGTYPYPKNGYPGFWWFTYGIRNVGFRLKSLEERGFIKINRKNNKYYLTSIGEEELGENLYVPYMHKHKKKTTEDTTFGPEFNVWSVNRAIGNGDTRDWREIALDQEQALGH